MEPDQFGLDDRTPSGQLTRLAGGLSRRSRGWRRPFQIIGFMLFSLLVLGLIGVLLSQVL